ncbi:MAG: tetratricopeptide repeat protein [Planctomycetota bacterium]|nr:tetratricopeptide repeat protein [Planctomycetota bacterium]
MKIVTKTRALAVFALIAGILFPSVALALPEEEFVDTIIEIDEKEGNKEVQGTITKETYDKISYIMPETGGAATGAVATVRVAEITYAEDSKSADFKRGEEAQDSGKWKDAIVSFQTALKDRNLRAIFKQHARYRLAVCCENNGSLEEAAKNYDALLKEFADSRFLREAYEALINVHIARGKPEDAEKVAAQAEKQARDLKLDINFTQKIVYLKGRVLEEKKMYPEAIKEFQRASADKTLDVASDALLAIGRCQVAQGQTDQAEETLRKVISAAQGKNAEYTKAGAWNSIGDMYRKKAESIKEGGPEKIALFDKALRTYLRSVVCWDKVNATGKWSGKIEEFGKAMYYCARCFDILKEGYKAEPEKSDRYRTRAQQLYAETAAFFVGTRWPDEARKWMK